MSPSIFLPERVEAQTTGFEVSLHLTLSIYPSLMPAFGVTNVLKFPL